MSRQRNKPKTTWRRSKTLQGGTGSFRLSHKGMNDRVSVMLRRSQKKYGNDDLSKQLMKANRRRDALLAFILQRLRTVRSMQIKEIHEINDREDWFRGAFRGRNAIPDPTRWKECAIAYAKAADALARGQFWRGTELMDEAIEKEYAAAASVPSIVEDDFDQHETFPEHPPLERPAEADEVEPGQTCSPIGFDPLIQQTVARIANVTSRAPLVGWRAKRPHNWWVDEEEEEEEEANAQG